MWAPLNARRPSNHCVDWASGVEHIAQEHSAEDQATLRATRGVLQGLARLTREVQPGAVQVTRYARHSLVETSPQDSFHSRTSRSMPQKDFVDLSVDQELCINRWLQTSNTILVGASQVRPHLKELLVQGCILVPLHLDNFSSREAPTMVRLAQQHHRPILPNWAKVSVRGPVLQLAILPIERACTSTPKRAMNQSFLQAKEIENERFTVPRAENPACRNQKHFSNIDARATCKVGSEEGQCLVPSPSMVLHLVIDVLVDFVPHQQHRHPEASEVHKKRESNLGEALANDEDDGVEMPQAHFAHVGICRLIRSAGTWDIPESVRIPIWDRREGPTVWQGIRSRSGGSFCNSDLRSAFVPCTKSAQGVVER
mmetsp:Transcript_104189/g.334258  ORF Transcript_104189/g.334258 Transcript_104189/m.334258 type:complete len:370 (+) Transcript_104189:216-1325(+)